MTKNEMKPLTAYRVTKSSSDKTVQEGDLVWIAPNGSLNLLDPVGWLDVNEWSSPETSDFEVVSDEKYQIAVFGNNEVVSRVKEGV